MANHAVYPDYLNNMVHFAGNSAVLEDNKEGTQQGSGKEVTIFGIKMSYGKVFGITFLILFVLLFFPGIGVGSASLNKHKQNKADEKENSMI